MAKQLTFKASTTAPKLAAAGHSLALRCTKRHGCLRELTMSISSIILEISNDSTAAFADRDFPSTIAEIEMKRFHVHLSVDDLTASVRFYSSLFGADPSVLKTDYAKWMVDEPRINFAISTNEQHQGVSHLGLQADSADELAQIQRSFAAADPRVEDEPGAACCYARSDKHWATDPQGIRWEGFHSRGLLEDEAEAAVLASTSMTGCCGPEKALAAPATKCCG